MPNAAPPQATSPARAWGRYVLAGLAALVFAFFMITGGVAYDVAWKLIHPSRIPIAETPSRQGLAYRDIAFPSAVDGVRLSGWLIPAARPGGGLVIEAHGYHQNRASDAPALPVAAALHRAGFAVLMFDFRAEGRSQGSEVTVGLYEQRDLRGAIDYARRLGYRRIGVIGYSMGAATALEVVAKDRAVRAVVADSAFADLYRYLSTHMPEWTNLPNWPFTPEIFFELRLINGLDVSKVDPLRDVAALRHRPVLLIAGSADRIVPMSNSQALYRALRRDPAASLWIVPGAKHVGAYTVAPKTYLARVTGFFTRALGSGQ
ncbi:alpha/beta hydrolase [Acidihalobacter prosperus]|uniref:Peptidase S9 prolyl oligopeptidase catalytic domain-containing protein n=1 Tax=Acidihalobacter prosperus TaxID=160660 RepID=A0A1A6C445_9GAMM|nr:alpha/beta fold hydrolase [Acidihalobacter prosperus]OBS09333.1 hypothetical protein Thpro_021661 [Acidihalobacter prosperus]